VRVRDQRGLVVALVFKGWPAALLRRPGARRTVDIAFTAVAVAGLNRALSPTKLDAG
jgi:hypothetical protein